MTPEKAQPFRPTAMQSATMAKVLSQPTKQRKTRPTQAPRWPTPLKTFLTTVLETLPELMRRSETYPEVRDTVVIRM